MKNEDTIYDNEATQYQSHDEEATQLDGTSMNNVKEEKTGTSEAGSKKSSVWKSAAAGMGTGILLGAATTFFSSSTPIDHQDGEEEESHPEWTDGEIPVANSVSDDMSFSEAFAAARTEVGSGGVFEWHGNIYSTFTKEEWDSMTQEQRDEYGSHFNWHNDHADNSTTTADEITTAEDVEIVATNNNEHADDETTNDGDELAVVISDGNGEEIAVGEVEPEVEILGVVHDDESGANIGGLVVDGQEVVLIDVDGDSTFDVMAADVNGDQEITQEELVDISDENLTVNDLVGVPEPDGSMYISNDNDIDYTNDSAVYDV